MKVAFLLLLTLPLAQGRVEANRRHSLITTAYSLRGTTYAGTRTRHGIAAVLNLRKFPPGTRLRILRVMPLSGRGEVNRAARSLTGRIVRVEDKIGHGSELDIWHPSERFARRLGRVRTWVEVLPGRFVSKH